MLDQTNAETRNRQRGSIVAPMKQRSVRIAAHGKPVLFPKSSPHEEYFVAPRGICECDRVVWFERECTLKERQRFQRPVGHQRKNLRQRTQH